MKKSVQRILLLAVCSIMVFGVFAGSYPSFSVFASEASAEIRVRKSPYINGTAESHESITDSQGVHLNVAVPFSGMRFLVATYQRDDIEATYSVYEWKDTYDDTVAEKPKASERIKLTDNTMQGINFDKLPAGEYLFLIHDASDSLAVNCYTEVESFNGEVYIDGFISQDALYPQCNIIFSEKLENGSYFLPCGTDMGAVDGLHTPPEESQIPKDSLIYTHEVMPDTWVFTDGLGRESLTNEDVGDPRGDRTLAMFYWTWHIDNFTNDLPVNLQEISEKFPDAINDYDNPLWSGASDTYYWDEPIYGYYTQEDEWVLRRQAELLANAGVDVIFSDNTNSTLVWKNAYTKLLNTWTAARADGVLTPKYSFMLPFSATEDSKTQLERIYLDMYRQSKWQELWYYLDGKPMIMAHSSNLSPRASNTEKEILNFFTFRSNNSGYIINDPEPNSWAWLNIYPQTPHYSSDDSKNIEQLAVGTAQIHNFKLKQISAMNGEYVTGRSYTSDYQDRYEKEGDEASKWGYNFAEQFEYAIKKDPKVIFVTGWNEWRVGRYKEWPEGFPTCVENGFPDQYNDEFSRDIEPTKGELEDHYYYQLVNYARQYKGARAIPTPSANVTIDMTAGNEQWKDVAPYYASYIGNTDDRNANGYGGLVYTETSGRNDIIGSQIARDDEFVYFHVECAENITPYTDNLWMTLYIDSDQKNQGWNTFEYVVNKSAASEKTLVLEKFTAEDDYSKTEKISDVEYATDGRYMTVKIEKSDLGLSGDDYTLNFSWTDNVHDEGDESKFSGDIMDFYISGDVAPGGRFKYSYISTEKSASATVNGDTDGSSNTGLIVIAVVSVVVVLVVAVSVVYGVKKSKSQRSQI